MLGPAANHRILVSHAADFTWRDGAFADLIPLLGDGLLTIDGDFHRRSRRFMLPAFHRERIAAALATMEAEIERAVAPWRAGATGSTVNAWARELALRVAMRALFGLDPDPGADGSTRRTSSSARSATTGASTGCRCCAARARRGRR